MSTLTNFLFLLCLNISILFSLSSVTRALMRIIPGADKQLTSDTLYDTCLPRDTCLEITDGVCPVAVSVTVSVGVPVLAPAPGHSQIFSKLFFLGLVHSVKLFQHVTRMLIHLTWQRLGLINFDKYSDNYTIFRDGTKC